MNTPIPPTRTSAIEQARQVIAQQPVYLDTETTGLDKQDEVVEITIVDDEAKVLFTSLVRPAQAIPPSSTAINGITNDMVKGAPTWPALWPTVRGHLLGKVVAAYNADFDLRLMQQSLTRYRLPWRDNLNMFDILRLYSEYRGEWDPARRSYRYFKLEEAQRFFNIPIFNEHRATADTLLARAVLRCIAGLSY
ncbi:MAG TPA: 3'-5' exonuclease [Longilinea sp.]|nr:3'-5' exonuclease [Longilinea sp.]